MIGRGEHGLRGEIDLLVSRSVRGQRSPRADREGGKSFRRKEVPGLVASWLVVAPVRRPVVAGVGSAGGRGGP